LKYRRADRELRHGAGRDHASLVIFSSVRLGVSPQIDALANLLVLFAACTILTATLILRREETRAREEK